MDSPIVDMKDDDFYAHVGQDIYRARGFKKMLVELDSGELQKETMMKTPEEICTLIFIDFLYYCPQRKFLFRGQRRTVN